jgi:hypothetical protein
MLAPQRFGAEGRSIGKLNGSEFFIMFGRFVIPSFIANGRDLGVDYIFVLFSLIVLSPRESRECVLCHSQNLGVIVPL